MEVDALDLSFDKSLVSRSRHGVTCVAAGVMDILGTRAVPHTFNKLRQVWFFQWLNLRVCDMSLPRALILAIAAVF